MSKVIFKITFKHPNLKSTTGKNIAYVKYIATRPGVDKAITESDLKKELEKGIENISSADETYLKYINERPRSHGLFGKHGIEDLDEVQKELGKVEGFVWRAIISIKEEDAKEIGLTDKEEWQTMIRANINSMTDKMKIKTSNLRWVAAVHMEKGHPHCHVMFWEKNSEIIYGVVNPKILDEIRKQLTDNIFEDQRLQLLNEKNAMRDLLRDIAKDDISKASNLVNEVAKAGQELNELLGYMNNEGIPPKMYTKEEIVISVKLKKLAELLPGNGRIALKFMPENVKKEVRGLAEYMLQLPQFTASLAKNLNAVEELTKIYTGNEEDIKKARDNSYNDIRDRLCQVILKGAAESQRKDIFYVDQELAENAVNFIKDLNNKINLLPEQTDVLNRITAALIRTGHTDEQISNKINAFIDKESLNFPKELVNSLIEQTRNSGTDIHNINDLSSGKKIDYYLSVLKLSNYNEDNAFSTIKETIKGDCIELEKRLQNLKSEGILNIVGNQYKLTNKGIEEFLKVKSLDGSEREILKMLESEGDVIKNVNFEELIENREILSNLKNRDPDEFKLSKFDAKIRNEFGDNNSLNFKGLEEKIYSKYTDDEANINTDKADSEIEFLEKRIEKLAINGYIKLDRESGSYSFIQETNSYFEYDEKKEEYIYTQNAMDKMNIKGMEFTRYDANVTLSYLDKCEDGLLTDESLKKFLNKEITNKAADDIYKYVSTAIDSGELKDYIIVSESGDISSTEKGQELSRNMNKVNQYFFECKGELTKLDLNDICIKKFGLEKGNIKAAEGIKQLDSMVSKNYLNFDKETGIYKINTLIDHTNKLLYQLYKQGGSINKNELKSILQNNIFNIEANKQYKYLLKRLEYLKKSGYLIGEKAKYSLSEYGLEKRKDLLVPQRDLLRKKLSYLEKLGLIKITESGSFQATDKYYSYMKNIAISKLNKIPRESNIIEKDIAAIIDRTQDNVDVNKIQRNLDKITNGQYINGGYNDIKSNYDDMRSYCSISNLTEKTINNISISLLASGISLEETKEIISEWNLKSNSNIEPDKLNQIIEKANGTVTENNLWGKITVISTDDWKSMFNSLGIDENNIPKWMYKGKNWGGLGFSHIATDIWKCLWNQLEIQRMHTEMQAQYMKKRMIKQQAMSNKSAMVEQARKNKDRGSLYHDDELEL